MDPIHESMDALSVAYALLKSHEVIDLLIIMLGTNDVKERFGANAACIAAGLERLILKCKSVDCWGAKAPNILVVAPPRIKEGFHDPVMGEGCGRDPPVWRSSSVSSPSGRACTFWTPRAASSIRSTLCT